MSWDIISSSAFDKAAKKYIKYKQIKPDELGNIIEVLANDPYSVSLKTHKLSGKLEGSLSCRVNYSIRIIFSFQTIVDRNGKNIDILFLETLGTHDEVY